MEMENTTKPVQTWLEHIRQLSVVIGPRGSTTPGERRGAEYCQSVLKKLGLAPILEQYTSAASMFHPHLLCGLLMLLSFIVYAFGGRLAAGIGAFIAIFSLASELLELGFRDNFFRRVVPKGRSQNVVSVIPPAGEHRQDLVLIGHIDTQRTPIIFRSAAWVKAYQSFTTLAFVLFLAQVVLYVMGTIYQWGWIWYASIPSAVGAGLLVAICIEADLSPYTAGANDNATAVGMVLTLAEALKTDPLQHTRVYAVCTGCEEVQHSGAIDFFKRHRAEMKNPKGLVFEMLGCAGPAWETAEGIIVPFHPDAGMLHLIETLTAAHPEWGAYPAKISGGNTELADCVTFKVPALTLFGMTPRGGAPYWHQVADTFDKMDPQVMQKTHNLTWTLIHELDKRSI